jgi:diguanylate cyclase (GGDEF)-like protein
LDWASFIFGAFVSCVAGFGATALVVALIMRRQSIGWMAMRAGAIGLLALTFPPAGPWLFPSPDDWVVARIAATDLVIAVVGPLLATYIEPEIRAPRLRAALWAVLPLGLVLAAASPLTLVSGALYWLHHFAILLLVTGIVVGLGLALRLGSRTARYQAVAWAPAILTGFAALYHELVLLGPMPFYAEAMLASFLFEFVVTAAGIGHGFALMGRELDQAVRNVTEANRVSTLDPLTGIANRRGLAKRFADPDLRRPVALAVIDCDHFKRINDNFGHDVGDEVLTAVAEALRGDNLFVGRLGGEEFVALIYSDEWQTIAEETRCRVSIGVRLRVPQLAVRVTASAGVALVEDEDTLRTAIKRADRALYAAKDGGRDRLVVAARHEGGELPLARVV